MDAEDNSGQDIQIYGGTGEEALPVRLQDWTEDQGGRLLAVPEATALSVLAMHGNLCLALRHPENVGPSRRVAIEAVHMLERVLAGAGLLTAEDRHQIRQDSPETRMCRVCGCIDTEACADPHHEGEPCYWVADDLCSACVGH